MRRDALLAGLKVANRCVSTSDESGERIRNTLTNNAMRMVLRGCAYELSGSHACKHRDLVCRALGI